MGQKVFVEKTIADIRYIGQKNPQFWFKIKKSALFKKTCPPRVFCSVTKINSLFIVGFKGHGPTGRYGHVAVRVPEVGRLGLAD